MNIYLGIDVGSISTNLVSVNAAGEVLFSYYGRVDGKPVPSVQQAVQALFRALSPGAVVAGVCTTGSARVLVAAVVGADLVKNEITAHARAALHVQPDVRTICEIGGQDSKVTILRDGVVVDFGMNLVCAAGTGSFLDSQAKRLNITIEELSERAMLSSNPTSIAGRCTVFAESDMIHKQQVGFPQEDIIMGLCQAMVRNYLNNVCKGKPLEHPILFQGGVSSNRGIRRALQEILGGEVIVPRYGMVMGAYGAALIARSVSSTRFRGFDVAEHPIGTRAFCCDGCANRCEILEVLDNTLVISRMGGRCGKWESAGEAPLVVPAESSVSGTQRDKPTAVSTEA
jgi:predicted CoA-substrate-specific enzyme activase